MRKILFKAKRMNWENLPKEEWWVEGYYYKTYGCRNGIKSDAHFIYSYEDDESYRIDSKTICEYTGLTGKNGRKIFEGDIVRTNSGRLCKVVWFSSPQYQGWDLVPIETKNRAPKKWRLWEDLEIDEEQYLYCPKCGRAIDYKELRMKQC